MSEELRDAILLELERWDREDPSTIPGDEEIAAALEMEDIQEVQRNFKILESRGLVKLHATMGPKYAAQITSHGLDVAEQLRTRARLSTADLPELLAKLAGLRKVLGDIQTPDARFFRADYVRPYFEQFAMLVRQLREVAPVFSDMPERTPPDTADPEDTVPSRFVDEMIHDLDYIFEVRAHEKSESSYAETLGDRVFISHGSSSEWMKLQAFLERDLRIPTLELAQEPNLGRTVLQKLTEESDRCRFAVVVMTGDDQIEESAPRARENVMHEIGFFQGKYGLRNVSLLYEEGTSIPSNIHGLVYIPFPKDRVEATFGALQKELQAALKR